MNSAVDPSMVIDARAPIMSLLYAAISRFRKACERGAETIGADCKDFVKYDVYWRERYWQVVASLNSTVNL